MVALLLAMGVAVAARNLVPFQLTISDQSPLVEFSTTGTVAWNSSFSRSAWTTHTDGQAGMGASWHWINTTAWDSYARPNFSIGVSASDIIVNGDVNGSPPNDTAIDAVVTEYSGVQTGGAGPTGGTNTSGVPASQGVKLSPGQLARVSGLDVNKPLSVQFTITEAVPSVYNVRGFVVTTALWSDAETFDKVPQSTAWFVVDGKPNSQFKVDESVWTVNTSTIYDDYTRRNVSELFCPRGDQNANVTIHVPLRTSFVVLNGTVGPDRSGPSYHWTPVPPGWRPSDMQSGGARSPWVSGQLLHAQRLDPDVNYVLDVTQSTLGNVHLDTVTFYSANHTGSPAKSDVGPIVGGVVGGVCGALVLTLLCFYWCFWRPRKHREREGEATQNTDGSGFDPFSPSQNDDDEGQEPLMQETDAGRVVLPPQYTPRREH